MPQNDTYLCSFSPLKLSFPILLFFFLTGSSVSDIVQRLDVSCDVSSQQRGDDVTIICINTKQVLFSFLNLK